MNPGERLPRYKRKPGAIRNFDVTQRDEQIVLLVARHRFIRSDQIAQLLKAANPTTSAQNVSRRLQLLFHDNFLGRITIESDRIKPGSAPDICMLGNKGIDLLANKYGFRRSSADWTSKARTAADLHVAHALEVTNFMVALALACRHHGHLEVVYFDQIMRELAPPETRASKTPYSWPVSVRPIPGRWPGRATKTLYAIPDRIFGLRNLEVPEERGVKFYFLEADRGTMPVERTDLDKSSLLRKLILYGFTHRDGLHGKYYGLPHFRVLTVVPTRQRIGTILAAHQKHTKSLMPAPLCLFADRRGLLSAEDFFAYPWIDAGGAPHRLLD
jgi:Replication-relaxation